MKEVFKRCVTVLMTVVLFAALLVPANAAEYYQQVNASLTIEGCGSYTLEGVAPDWYHNTVTVTTDKNDKGTFSLNFTEPGQYGFKLYSQNPEETAVWNVFVDVVVDETDSLVAIVTCINPETGEKPMKITYLTEEPEPTPTPTPVPTPRPPGPSVKTGDTNNILSYVAGGVASCLVAMIILTIYKKNEKEEV